MTRWAATTPSLQCTMVSASAFERNRPARCAVYFEAGTEKLDGVVRRHSSAEDGRRSTITREVQWPG